MGLTAGLILGVGTAVGVGSAAKKALTPPRLPSAPRAPSEDTAANAANQEADLARRRRGVLANIYAGGQDFKPQTAVKTLLGA